MSRRNTLLSRPATKYVPSGVFLDRPTLLSTSGAIGNVSDSTVGTLSFWLLGTASNATIGAGTSSGNNYLNADIISNLNGGSETTPGLQIAFDNAVGNYGTLRVNLNDTTGGASHSLLGSYASLTINGLWTHYLISWDTSQGWIAVYQNGIKITGTITGTNIASIHYTNSNGLGINKQNSGDPAGAYCLADLFLDFARGICSAQATIPTIVVQQFYNGGPVNLGPTGIRPLGFQPSIYLTGDKTAFGTNVGSATGLTPTGTFYNSQTPVSPPIPSKRQAFHRWTSSTTFTNAAGVTTNGTANPIIIGDLLLLCINLVDTTHTTGTHTITPPAGWTQLINNWFAGGAADDPTQIAIYWRFATAADVTANGAYAFSWTPNQTKTSPYTLSSFGNCSGVEASAFTAQTTASTSMICPSITGTSCRNTLVSIYVGYSAGAGVYTPATGQDLLSKLPNGGSPGQLMLAGESWNSTIATGTRTGTQPSQPYQTASILLGTN